MRVTWITHLAMHAVCEEYHLPKPVSGGWLETMKNQLIKNEDIELSIVCIEKTNRDNYHTLFRDGVNYHLIQTVEQNYYGKFTTWYLEKLNGVVRQTMPDLIHIHGTEFAVSLALEKELTEMVPVCVSIQGLISVIADRYYLGGIRKGDMRWNERIILDMQHRKVLKRGIFEEEILRRYRYFLGRTDWDYSHIMAINREANYLVSNETVRSEFQESVDWCVDDVEPHSIFCAGGARIPIKGFHQVLKATSLLMKKYPDLKIYVPGNDPRSSRGMKSYLGYTPYLKRKIQESGLSNSIIFVGTLDAGQMATHFRKAHCYVMSSAIENSPNTLFEAMHVGTPCVVSMAGGVQNFVHHQQDAFVYRFEEYEMLAYYIEKIFESKDVAERLSINARAHIREQVDTPMSLAHIYEEIQEDYKEA